MNTHVITLTKRIVIGEKVLDNLKEYMPKSLLRAGGKAVIVAGPNVWKNYGERLVNSLSSCNFETEEFLVENSHIETANQAIDVAEKNNATIIVGFGGGKSIDIAKYAASILQRPFISVPTAPSHDGIASPFASIKGLGKPMSIRAIEPTLLIADMDIIYSSPRRLIIAGAGDTIAKFTAVLDWRLAHYLKNEYYGEYAASLALLSAKHIVKYKDVISSGTKEGIRIILEALVSSSVAMEIAGSTRPASGSEHLFSHALDMLLDKPALHGEQTGIGTIMMAKLHRLDWRKIRQVLLDIGAPVTAKQLGISEEKVIEALTIAHRIRPERYTILGETGLTWEAAEKLARETMIIP